ncbi:MAG: hypothetical protein AAGU15_03915 [Anaerolineaceae bacterium]|jgi:phenylacetate-CoA ligase
MGITDTIYSKLPSFLQNWVVSLYGLYWKWLRFGGEYNSFVKAYASRDIFSEEKWASFQSENLKKLLQICMNTVPYYSREWTLAQKRAALNGDLFALPLMEKAPFRANPNDFVRIDRKPLFKITNYTSGSTGTPIASIVTASEMRKFMAIREVRSAGWARVSFNEPRATFSGRLVEPDPESKGPFYRLNSVEQQVYFSPYHLRPDTAHFYIEALKRHKIQWMTGYAVSYYLLAKFVIEAGLEVPPLKGVITTSEKLTPEMRLLMEKAYGCRVYEEYSTVENVLFASECEHGRLHISPDAGVVEILRSDGSPCDPGEVGEVVATSFLRTYQPLIRYRLGDLAAWDIEPCPCGRAMPVIKEVVGRLEDVVVGPDGRQLVRFHGIFTNQPNVIEGQIIQEALDRIRVKIVPTEGFSEIDTFDIINRVHQRIGKQVEVVVELVQGIERTKYGKFKAVISLIQK